MKNNLLYLVTILAFASAYFFYQAANVTVPLKQDFTVTPEEFELIQTTLKDQTQESVLELFNDPFYNTEHVLPLMVAFPEDQQATFLSTTFINFKNLKKNQQAKWALQTNYENKAVLFALLGFLAIIPVLLVRPKNTIVT